MQRDIEQYLMQVSIEGYISLDNELRAADRFGVSIRDIEHRVFQLGLMPLRYRRNGTTFSFECQKRLFDSSVAVIGCGGLGGYLIEELARIGVGTIKAVDLDVFEEHNLNRQVLSDSDRMGKPKVIAALERVRVVNPAVNLIPLGVPFNEHTAQDILSGVQAVADGLDSIHSRLLLARMCNKYGVALVYGSIGGWYGQVSVQHPGDRHLESLFEGRGDKGMEEELGNPSFTPAVVASIQAAEVCKILLGLDNTLRNKLLVIDLKTMGFRTLSFRED